MFKLMTLFLTMLFTLTACYSPVYNQTEANVADVKLKEAAARAKSDCSGRNRPSLLVNRGLYVDTTPINLKREPAWLRNHMVLRGDQLPFSYYSRTIASGAGSKVLTKFQTGLDPAVGITMNYSGSVRGALDLLAAKTGYVYSIHENTVYWQAFLTRTFDIAFMPGGTDYLMGKPSGGGAGTQPTAGMGTVTNYTTSDDSDAEYSNLKATLSIWKDLDATIKQLLSPEGKVMVSESTTSVTVRDRPSNVALVAQYIKNLNHTLSKQVLVKVQVLDVILENDFTFGINWQIIANAFNKSPFVLNSSFGTPVSITSFTQQTAFDGLPATTATTPPQFGTLLLPNTPNPIPSYTILFNALNQQGKTSVVTEPRVVCLNNQVSVVRIVRSQGYLASVQNTSLASGTTTTTNVGVGTVTSQVTPGTQITGLTLYILPKILKANIYLQVNADLSTAAPFRTASSGQGANTTTIELPDITEKHFNQRSVIKSGDTLILAGFRQVQNTANANQFLTSQALGGKGSTQTNRETVVLITPIILDGSA